MADNIFLLAWGKPLLILHALLGMLLLGTSTHHALIAVPWLWGSRKKLHLNQIYVNVGLVAYLLTFGLGAVIYPNYRYTVRALYFDKDLPWASQLFDVKEHWAGIGLGLFVSFFVLSRLIDPRSDRAGLFVYVFLSVSLALIVWFSLISGLLLTAYRSI
ncbi:MAG: hypothetical protein IGS03_18700 [Candidatus Sericytochromatia bacterium]|nr:hypothetical protein [Candidatus Sericytochromatia bacterium]